jgi:4-amino-4-deoxy-L-arabinose transferase-like glycosyltransferase
MAGPQSLNSQIHDHNQLYSIRGVLYIYHMSNALTVLTASPSSRLHRRLFSEAAERVGCGFRLAGVITLLYAALAIGLHDPVLHGDELRYYDDARHLTEGWFVSDEFPRIYNGPGYPAVLAVLVAIDAPILAMRLLGSLMVGLSAWLLWQVARRFMTVGWAAGFVIVCSFHPSLLRNAHLLMTEPMTQLAAAGFLWAFVRVFDEGKWRRWVVLSALALVFWAMTRVFMGHVILATTLGSLALLLLPAARRVAARTAMVTGLAFLMCVPYLIYTHGKAGGWLTWSTSTGEMLYWMTSHEGGENGLWYDDSQVFQHPELSARHGPFLKGLHAMGHLEREAEMKRVAMQRIKENPLAIGKNWVCNVCRLFFGFPRSLEREKLNTLGYVVINGGLLVGLLAGGLLTWWRRERLPDVVIPLLLMATFFVGGSTLAPALPRYLMGIWMVVAFVACVSLSRFEWRKIGKI